MQVEQIYTGCLSQASYIVVSNGEAAIIDPVRDQDLYFNKLKKYGNLKVKYIFETHFHADFVSGHLDLAKFFNSKIVFGPGADTSYNIYKGKDNEEFKLGKIIIKLLHTPGHTFESSCYLLIDELKKNHALFSGDTIFIGDVGRPDLAVSKNANKEDLAATLYDSIYNKIYNLNDDLIIYPAHGAGSLCGKNMSSETSSTLGVQKKYNNALILKTKKEFVSYVSKDLPPTPSYFIQDVDKNINGYKLLDDIIKDSFNALNYNDFNKQIKNDVVILDTRKADIFGKSFIPGSINISLNGNFAIWAARLINLDKKISLVTDIGSEMESIVRLSRVGFENIIGFIEGGFETWKLNSSEVDSIVNFETEQAHTIIKNKLGSKNNFFIVDVRNNEEYNQYHFKNVLHYELNNVEELIKKVNKNDEILIHCAGGYRSMIAASILKKNNINNVINIKKGIDGFINKLGKNFLIE